MKTEYIIVSMRNTQKCELRNEKKIQNQATKKIKYQDND